MKIGIIAAMRKEIELLLPLIDERQELSVEGIPMVGGKVGEHKVCVAESGIGKVNSALVCDAMIRVLRPDMIVNSGVAGGADLSMHICDVLIADGAAYHDVWCGPGTKFGAAHGFPQVMRASEDGVAAAHRVLGDGVRYGLICSGDKFITTADEIAEIKGHFPEALAVDMESASIAQVAMRHNVPFMIVRAISDTPGSGENISQYEDFWTKAPENTFHALSILLKAL